MKKPWLWFQSLLLLIGSIVAVRAVIIDFNLFYSYEGTLFKVKDCIIPNPVVTPCFYGAIAFVLSLVWSLTLLRRPERKKFSQKHLAWFLGAGTIFGWSNFVPILLRFNARTGTAVVGCSGQLTTNPFTTPCFYGSVLFTLSFIVAAVIAWRRRKVRPNPLPPT